MIGTAIVLDTLQAAHIHRARLAGGAVYAGTAVPRAFLELALAPFVRLHGLAPAQP